MLKSMFFILFLVFANSIFAQDLQYEINSASATVRKDCFLVNWSLGVIDVESFANEEIGFVNNWLYEESADDFQDNLGEEIIYIYPNPVSEILNIKVEKQCKLPFKLSIYNLNGRKVFYKVIHNNRESINLSFLAQGVYIIEFLHDDKQLEKFKIIKY